MSGKVTKTVNRKIIRRYTRESSVRNLEERISKIAGNVVKKIDAKEKRKTIPLLEKDLKDLPKDVQRFTQVKVRRKITE